MKKIIYCLFFCSAIANFQRPHGFGINFDHSMGRTHNYKANKLDKWMKINRDLYNKYVVRNPEYSEEPRIPKIIHHIWVGSPLPPAQTKFRESWKRMHPDWEFMFWDDQAIAEFGLENQVAYDAAINLSEKSDIARYEILYRFGGLYVDTDFQCLKPFDAFHHCLDFFCGAQYLSIFRVFNGLMASVPGHPILRACIDNIQPQAPGDKNLWSTLWRTGPSYLEKQMKKFLPQYPERVVAFPITYFYPVPFWEREKNWDQLKQRWVIPQSFAIHYWHVSWNGYHR